MPFTKLLQTDSEVRWEVAKFVASKVRIIRCSWFDNIHVTTKCDRGFELGTTEKQIPLGVEALNPGPLDYNTSALNHLAMLSPSYCISKDGILLVKMNMTFCY